MSVEWFKKAVIYQILIDRFAGADKKKTKDPVFAGGNIKGIIKKLPYLKKLGVNTLWLSPFYKTNAYHGYHITDFFKVDPHFGTLNDLKTLIKEAHKRDIRLIADFAPNHLSCKHPFFLDAQKDKDSQYRDWFFFKNWPDDYMCFLSVKEIPKINLDNPDARQHVMDAARYWLKLGFDGYRLDHILGPKHSFWKGFRREIKSEFPDAVLIGEAWMWSIKFNELKTINVKNKYWKWLRGDASDSMLKEYVGEMDGVMDFRFQQLMRQYIAEGKGSIDELKTKLARHFLRYPKDYFLVTFLDNHDMDRFLFSCKGDKSKLKQAAELQFAIGQPTIIYYGTEKGMSQKRSMKDFKEHGDLVARESFDAVSEDKSLFKFYQALIKNKLK